MGCDSSKAGSGENISVKFGDTTLEIPRVYLLPNLPASISGEGGDLDDGEGVSLKIPLSDIDYPAVNDEGFTDRVLVFLSPLSSRTLEITVSNDVLEAWKGEGLYSNRIVERDDAVSLYRVYPKAGHPKLWNYFKHDKAVNAHKVLFNNSRNSNAWIDFIKSKSSSYIDNELHNAFDNQGHGHIIIVFIGRLNLDETGKYVSSFIQLIHELAKNIGDKFPVFIKPHIFSDLDFLEKCILEGIGNYTMNYIITKLHPSVLASRAAIALFVNNSTVIHEISNLNVPIIQCLYGFNRDEALNESSNKSNYVMTKGMDNLSVIVNKLLSVNASPIVYRKKQEKIDCSFLLH